VDVCACTYQRGCLILKLPRLRKCDALDSSPIYACMALVLMHKGEDVTLTFILTVLSINKQTILWNVNQHDKCTHVLFAQCLPNHNEQVTKYFVNLVTLVDTASEIPFFKVPSGQCIHVSSYMSVATCQ
jgi:hypothetical protein